MMYTDDFKKCLIAATNVLYATIQHEETLTVRAYIRQGKVGLLNGNGFAASTMAENAKLESTLFDVDSKNEDEVNPAVMAIANLIYMREFGVYYAD